MPTILLLEPIHADGITLLRGEAAVRLCPDLRPETIRREAADADAVIVRSVALGREIIESAPRLKVIGRHGAGVDNIDLETATARKIAVVNTPTANSQSVAEHVILSMLVLAKKAALLDRAMREGRFARERASLPRLAESLGFTGQELWRKTAGIVGLGRIGRKVADACRAAFAMTVLAYDPYLPSGTEAGEGIHLVDSLHTLLRESDFVSLHLPLTPQTRGMIGTEELSVMKKEAFLINAARGGVVDEAALVEALSAGALAGAAVDVFAEEPPPADHPFFRLDNVFVTPHIAAITTDALSRMSLEVAEGVLDALHGRRPRFLVNPAALD